MWVWILSVCAIALFLYLRSQTYTEEEARLPADKSPGFGAQITLWAAAKGYFGHLISWLLVIAWITAIAIRLYVGQWSWYDVAVVAVIGCTWPLQEWFVHAHLEHLKPIDAFGRTFELVITRTHRAHHRNPWDPRFGLSPPHVMVLYFVGLPLFCYLTAPLPLAITATAITLTMIINYEWVHYLIHTSYPPQSRFYRRLWRHHRLHHFKNEEYWFGLTMLSGDTVMGTNPTVESAAHSPTCMTLGHGKEEWFDQAMQEEAKYEETASASEVVVRGHDKVA